MSLNPLNTSKTLPGILTRSKGIAIITCNVWNVPHNIPSANEKNTEQARYTQNSVFEVHEIVAEAAYSAAISSAEASIMGKSAAILNCKRDFVSFALRTGT
jgi:hypothetical protein